MPEQKSKILVLGGYGNFGKRISTILAKDPDFAIIVAGHSLEKAQNVVAEIKEENPLADIQALCIDWQEKDFIDKLALSKANILIHTAGPFQTQDYTVATACIDLKIHYVDLADAREFVVNIKNLDERAKEAGVCVVSGATSVPGLSSTVIDKYASKFGILTGIDFGIAPGNKVLIGKATLAGVLENIGKPFMRLENGRWKLVYGWQNVHRHYYGDNLGYRWQANLDIPDLVLLPEKYPTLKNLVFHVGLEVSVLHFLMWKMSWLSRLKIVKNWASMTKTVHLLSRLFNRWGTDKGGMYVHMVGSNLEYQPLEINWTIVAEKGDGPFIPVIPNIIVIKKIIQGLITPGARPCMGMFSLTEFDKALASMHMYTTVEERVM